jgi:hypothetical protein
MALNVLMIESKPGAGRFAGDDLRTAGHNVVMCHSGEEAFPCRGILDPSACPLRAQSIDVALLVRDDVRIEPTPHEDGARCALFQRVPLVVEGVAALSPYGDVAAATISPGTDVVAACERIAHKPIADLSKRATDMLGATLGPDAGACVVTREKGELQISVYADPDLSHTERSRAAVRIVAAVRERDPFAAGIDVVFA